MDLALDVDHDATECVDRRAGRTCSPHWQYLLGNRATRLVRQCPDRTRLWAQWPMLA